MATQSRYEYDVFLSFRGEDVRKTFVDHLRRALDQRGIRTFKDDSDRDLPRGKAISPELIRAIEESRYVLVVFSENYASSSWCLEEIAKIVECKDLSTGSVIPIFYHVNPSDIRKIKGSFEKHFAKHEEDYKNNSQVLKKWKDALKIVADLSGENLSDGHESEFIQKVVDEIESRLGRRFSYVAGKLVGIESRVAEVVEQLCLGEGDVRIIGIWGMGGVGKTTTARAICDSIRGQFEGSSFLANVREVSEKNGLECFQKQLLYDILRDNNLSIWDAHQGANMIKERLQYKKVILVLDDVDKGMQLEKLAGGLDWFGNGSRIIITTRNEHLLREHEVNYTYKAEGLTNEEALKLLSLKAFKSDHPPKEFSLLAEQVVAYANGLPLALKVLGSFLFKRNLEAWQSALARLEECPDEDIFNNLKISYDGLHEKEKELFLDIACFFKGNDKSDVVELLESCDLYPKIGIQVLLDKSLLTIEDNKLHMHDLLQAMGRGIVRQEFLYEPGKRSRIWLFEDTRNILTNNLGSANIKGIVLQSGDWIKVRGIDNGLELTKLKRSLLEKAWITFCRGSHETGRGNDTTKKLPNAANLRGESFANMTNLRFLCVCGIHLSSGLKHLSNELRLLTWDYYNLKSFPPSFNPWNLVELNMRSSSMRKLWRWNKMQVLEKLKVMNLSHSKRFVKTPNFKNVPNLERLILRGCGALHKVHPSIGVLQNLILLDLSYCHKLKSLPDSVGNLSSLKVLDLYGCTCLKELPERIGRLKCLEELNISGTAITNLPRGLAALEKLKILRLRECDVRPRNSLRRGLQRLSFSGLSNLTELDMSYCNLQAEDILCLSSLRSLYLSGNNFTNIPSSICDILGLEILEINSCENVEELPRLPESIFLVNATNCFQLKRISNPFIMYQVERAISAGWFINCYIFLPENLVLTSQQKYYLSSLRYTICCSVINSERDLHCMVSPSEYGIPEWFRFQKNGSFLHMEMPPRWFNKYWSGFAIYASLKRKYDYSFGESPNIRTVHCDLYVDGGHCLRDSFEPRIKLKNSGFLWLGFTSNREFLHNKAWEAITGSSHINFQLSTVDDRWEIEECGVHPVYKQNPADFDAFLDRWASLSPQDWDRICHELHNSIPMREDGMTRLRYGADLLTALKTAFQGDRLERLKEILWGW